MTQNIVFPAAVFRYKRHKDKDGEPSKTRWDLVSHEGQEFPCLVRELKREGAKVIYYAFNSYTNKTGLWRGAEGTDSGWLSEVFQPDIKKPGLGFGDLRGRADAALLFKENTQADSLTIMVFPGLGNQSKTLFEQWQTGAVKESCLNNNVNLDTLFVQNKAHD